MIANKKLFSLLISISLFLAAGLSAKEKISLAQQILGQSGPIFTTKRNWTLRNITFKGKLKTKQEIALDILKIRPGMVLTNVSITELRTNLVFKAKKDRYFYDIETAFKPSPPYLDVTLRVKEKWSIFPIPIFSYSDNRLSYGFGFVDMNFLGSKNQIGGTLLYKDDYLSFNAMININKLFLDKLGIFATVFSAKKKQYIYDPDLNYKEIGSYNKKGVGYMINFRYHCNDLRFWLKHTLINYSFSEADHTHLRQSMESIVDASIILKQWISLEDYETGHWLRFTFRRDVSWLGSDYDRFIFNWSFSFALNVLNDHNLLIDHSGILSHNIPEELYLEIGNSTSGWVPAILGYRSGQYNARHFIFNRLEYRIPFASTKHFNFAIVAFTEHMTFTQQKAITGMRHIFNAGLSFRIYLRRLLIPAVVLYGVYAEDNKSFDFGISLGASI